MTRGLEAVQRIRLPPGAVEREHVPCTQALPMRMLGDERLELADERGVPTLIEIRRDAGLERGDPVLLEPSAF